MAYGDPTARAAIDVEVRDQGVESRLAAIDAAVDARLRALDRKEATIKIKADVSDLKIAAATARTELSALDRELEKQNRKIEQSSGAAQRSAQRRRADLNLERQALLQNLSLLERRVSDLKAEGDQVARTSQLETVQEQRRTVFARAEQQRQQTLARGRSDEISQTKDVLDLNQKIWAEKKRIADLERQAGSARGTQRIEVQMNLDRARFQYDMFRRELEARGHVPITQDVRVNESGLSQFKNFLLFWDRHGKESKTTLDNFGQSLDRLGRIKVNVGPFNASLKGLFATITLGAPAVAALGGALGALIGTLGSGLLGAAGLGGAALTGFGMVLAGLKADLHPFIQQLSVVQAAFQSYQTAVMKYGPPGSHLSASASASAAAAGPRIALDQQRVTYDQTAYNHVVAQYGKNSMQAAASLMRLEGAQNSLTSAQRGGVATANQSQKALDRYNNALKSLPPQLRAAVVAENNLRLEWQKLTKQNTLTNFGDIVKQGAQTARANINWFAKDTNIAFNDIRIGWDKWMKDLRSPEAKDILGTIFSNFDKTIQPVMSAFGHLGAALGRWFATMSNYLPGIAKGFDAWAKGVNNAAILTDGWNSGAHTLMASLSALGRLAAGVGRFLFALFAPSVGPGNSLVDDMANSLDRAAKSMRTVQGQRGLHSFFQQSVKGAEELWHAVTPLAQIFISLAQGFAPIAKAALPVIIFFERLAANIIKSLGPFGTFLRDAAGLLVALRLLGKIKIFGESTILGVKKLWTYMVGIKDAAVAIATGKGLRNALSGFRSATSTATAAEEVNAAIVAAFEEGGGIAAADIRAAMSGMPGRPGTPAAPAEPVPTEVAPVAEGAAGAAAVESAAGGTAAGGGVAASAAVAGSEVLGVSAATAAGIAALPLIVPGIFLIANALGLGGSTPKGIIDTGAAPGFSPGGFKRQRQVSSAEKLMATLQGGISNADWGTVRNLQMRLDAAKKDNTLTADAAKHLQHILDVQGGHIAAPKLAQTRTQIQGEITAGTIGGAAQASTSIFQSTTADLQGLSMKARVAGSETMIGWVRGMESKGQLAKGTTQMLIRDLEALWGPKFAAALGRDGRSSMNQMDAAVKNAKILDTTQHLISKMHDLWIGFPTEPKLTMKNWVNVMGADMDYLHNKLVGSSGKTKKQLEADISELSQKNSAHFGAMTSNVIAEANSLATGLQHGSKTAGQTVTTNFFNFSKNIHAAMKAGLISTTSGANKIKDALNATLHAFGQNPIKASINIVGQIASTIGSAAAMVAGPSQPAGSAAPAPSAGFTLASGGRVPGSVGPDNWILADPSGRPVANVGAGELLISNRHTERRVDEMLSYFGTSLDEQVNGETRMHSQSFARGGRMRKFATGGGAGSVIDLHSGDMTEGQEPQILSDLYRLSGELGQPVYIISGYRTPQHSVAVGGFADDPHTRGQAADIGVGSASRDSMFGVSENQLHAVGLYRPFYPPDPNEVNHVQLLGGGPQGPIIPGLGGSALSVPTLKAPHAKGTGTMTRVVQGGLNKMTAAANKKLQSIVGAMGGMVSGAGVAPGSWMQVATQLAKKHGWGPSEVQAWLGVERLEDGSFSLTAKNPTSSAYGLAQFINGPGEYAQYGGNATSLVGQLTAMANYIAQRYGTPSAALAFENANHYYARGGRLKKFAAGGRLSNSTRKPPTVHQHGSSTATTHHTSSTGIGLSPSEKEAVVNSGWQTKIWDAYQRFNDYRHKIYSTHHKHVVGTPGHWNTTGTRWIASTIHQTGGIPKSEFETLTGYEHAYQKLLRQHPGYNVKHPFSTVWAIPPKDRIGGVGTNDIDAALQLAQNSLSNYDTRIHSATDSKGHRIKPTKADLAHEAKLQKEVHYLQFLQRSANSKIQDFSLIENAIDQTGGYMDLASSSPNEMAKGIDYGMSGKVPGRGRERDLTWSQWKQRQIYWEKVRLAEVKRAYNDVRRRLGPHPNKWNLRYLTTLGMTESQDKADLVATRQTESPASQLSLDQYIKNLKHLPGQRSRERMVGIGRFMHKPGRGDPGKGGGSSFTGLGAGSGDPNNRSGFTGASVLDKPMSPSDEIERLQYYYSLDSGKVKEDDPGTSAREDILSSRAVMGDAQAIANYYRALLTHAQRDPKARNNYQLLTQISDAYNSAQQTYQQYKDAAKGAATAIGPGQVQLFDTARAGVFASFAGNVAPVPGVSPSGANQAPTIAGTAGAAAVAQAFGSPSNPALMSSPAPAAAPASGGGTTVHLSPTFANVPPDAHSWSKGVAWELQAAI